MRESLAELEFSQVLSFISKYAVSELGREIIARLYPCADYSLIGEELSLVEEMVRLQLEGEPVPFEGLHDVRPQLHKSLIANSVLSTSEMLNVRDAMRCSRLIKSYLSRRHERFPLLSGLATELHESIMTEKHIGEAIDDIGEVRDTASRELSRIRRSIFDKSNHLRSRLQKILRQVAEEDMVMEEFATIREDRFVIPVKAEHKRHIPGIIHGVSQTGQTVFLEPTEIFELNNEVSMLKNEEQREIYRILSALTAEVGDSAREFLHSIDVIARIDSLIARARYALEFGGVRPEVSPRKELYMRAVHHPILAHAKGIKRVVPLSIEFDAGRRGHLISGPNAGGKTVALKCIGLSVAMALSGIFPLGELKTDYRNIFCSIGDHQSIENDLSTFSSEIIKLRDIISACSHDSLVLVDEIGSGTDPHEGSALAAGILDSFLNMNLFFIATTHQSSLKSYALTRDEIENASLEFDPEKLKPTYNFLQGTPGNSYAFALAESLGLPQNVLDRAKNYIGTRQVELEESIAVLQRFKSEAEKLRNEAESEKLKAEKARNEFNAQLKELKAKKQDIVAEARREAAEIVAQSNALVEKTIREIREAQKPVGEIKREFNERKEQIQKKVEQLAPQPADPADVISSLAAGDSVTLDTDPTVGTVVSSDDKAKTALVEFNGLKFRLPYKRLTLTKKKVAEAKAYADYIDFSGASRIDLRGKRAEESLREIDEAISHALVANIPMLTIIHGKGTGALRAAVHDFLSEHPSVVSYRLGDLVEGGSGVTIVEL